MAFTGTLSRIRHFKRSVDLIQRNLSSLNSGTGSKIAVKTELQKLSKIVPRNLCTFSQCNKLQALKTTTLLCQKNSVILSSIRAYSSENSDGSEKRPRIEVDYDELLELIDEGNIMLIDVREPKEIEQSGLMPGAINIPITKLKTSLNMEADTFTELYKVPRPSGQGETLIFYGLSNVKSESASELAHKAGLKKSVYSHDSGFLLATTGFTVSGFSISYINFRQLVMALRYTEEQFQAEYGVEKPEDDTELVFSCLLGKRSYASLLLAERLGYSRARHYPGGWKEWSEKKSAKN